MRGYALRRAPRSGLLTEEESRAYLDALRRLAGRAAPQRAAGADPGSSGR